MTGPWWDPFLYSYPKHATNTLQHVSRTLQTPFARSEVVMRTLATRSRTLVYAAVRYQYVLETLLTRYSHVQTRYEHAMSALRIRKKHI